MRFKFIWIGKTKEKNWRALQDNYLRRLSHFVKSDIVEIKESFARETKEIEGKRILENCNQNAYKVLLDVQGQHLSSHELAQKVENWQNQSLKEIVFIIGGQDGVSSEVFEKTDFSFSLSKLTLTHEMARVVLIEQIYRAFTIIKNFPYQK